MPKTSRLKHRHIFSAVRRSIVSGEYGPGQRLPSRAEIGTQFDAGMATVQKALEDLTRDGFVRGRPGAGTFVVDRPPHLRNVALVFPYQDRPSRFYVALREASRVMASDEAIKQRVYYTSPDTRDRHDTLRLIDDISHHRVGGVIFGAPPFDLRGTAAIDTPGVPRVAIQYSERDNTEHEVFPDMDHFTERALRYLVSRGRRRIAHLYLDEVHVNVNEQEALLRRHGPEVRPYWVQLIPLGHELRGAARVVQLLLELEGDKRPNALVIHDDNLVEYVIAGLLAAGVKVPDELEVVAHTNFPSLVPTSLPIRRLGFDCRTLLNECLRVLDEQRAGTAERPAHVRVSAVFQEELSASPR